MRTSLNKIQQAEKYLLSEMEPQDALLFQAEMLTNPLLKLNVFFHRKVYSLLRVYNRKKVKEEAEAMHYQLFSKHEHVDFSNKIHQLFNP